MRFHTQTAGCSLWDKQPENNIVRTAFEALAGGAGRHAVAAHQLDGRDHRAAERQGGQDRAAHAADHRPRARRDRDHRSAGAARTTSSRSPTRSRSRPRTTSARSTAWAAWWRASSSGFFQREIGRAAYQYQQEMEKKQRVIVGVNEYVEPDEKLDIPILYIGEEVEAEQKRAHRRAAPHARRPRLHRGASGADRRRAPARRARQNVMEKNPRCRARLRHRGRDPQRDARGVRRLRREHGVLIMSFVPKTDDGTLWTMIGALVAAMAGLGWWARRDQRKTEAEPMHSTQDPPEELGSADHGWSH